MLHPIRYKIYLRNKKLPRKLIIEDNDIIKPNNWSDDESDNDDDDFGPKKYINIKE